MSAATPHPEPAPAQTTVGTGRLDPVPGSATCPVCGARFTPTGRQQTYCTTACRKTAYRRRHQHPIAAVTLPPPEQRSDVTVYQCPTCHLRLLGSQRCPDCTTFARRVDFGGACPHCTQPVALTDLLDPQLLQTLIPRVAVDRYHTAATLNPHRPARLAQPASHPRRSSQDL